MFAFVATGGWNLHFFVLTNATSKWAEKLHVAPPWCPKSVAFCASSRYISHSTEFEVEIRGWSTGGECTSDDFLLYLCSICNVTRRLQEGASNEGACEYFADSWSICQSRAHNPNFEVHFREKTMKIVTWTILKFCRKSGAIVDLGPPMSPGLTDQRWHRISGKILSLTDAIWSLARAGSVRHFHLYIFVAKITQNDRFCWINEGKLKNFSYALTRR